MTTHTRTRRLNVPAYYLGRPAALWLAALAPRSTTHASPRASCVVPQQSVPLGSGQHMR